MPAEMTLENTQVESTQKQATIREILSTVSIQTVSPDELNSALDSLTQIIESTDIDHDILLELHKWAHLQETLLVDSKHDDKRKEYADACWVNIENFAFLTKEKMRDNESKQLNATDELV